MRKLTAARVKSLAALFVLAAAGCGHSSGPANTAYTPRVGVVRPLPPAPGQSNVSNGLPLLPDPRMTPGATLPVTPADICVPGYTQKVRNVPSDVKRQVYAEYGIPSHQPGDFEVDHLISLELGGSNSIKNLWPESYRTQPWNAHVKDVLENTLHADVCSNRMDLPTAQRAIAGDWIAAYKQYVGASPGAAHAQSRHGRTASFGRTLPTAPMASPASGEAGTQVWVNLKSGKFFLPGAEYYGKTKRGAYMTQTEAVQHGYTPAR